MQRRRNGRQLLAVTLLTLTLDTVLQVEAFSIRTFEHRLGILQNILYINLSRHDGVVVVGGRNALYALSPDDLSKRAIYRTGPENDSVLCPPYPLSCQYSRNVTDNYNRILLQVGTEPLVLACGATSQGMCSIHDPQQDMNVTASMDRTLTNNYVASKMSTVAFFGTGNDGMNVLFSGTASDGRPPGYRLFTMAARVLDPSGSFALLSHAQATSVNGATSRLGAPQTLRFVYGFSHNGFAYFVVVRKVQKLFGSSLETRLARVCENDVSSFRTFVEVPITCSKGSSMLSVATSAHLMQSKTANDLGGNSKASVLAVAFGRPVTGKMSSRYLKLSSSTSVVCFFVMSSVEDVFRQTVENCNKGLSNARLSRLYHNEGDDLRCSHYGDPPRLLASLDTSKVGREISRSTAIDSNGAYGYFIISNTVARMPVGSCRIYESCSQCIRNQEDPLQCGWCGDQCAHFAECPDREKFSVGRCPIEVERVYPLNGPVSGGTVITILGDNFGSPKHKPYSSIEISIGNRTCDIIHWTTKQVKCRTPPAQYSSKVDILINVNDIFSNTGKSYHVVQNHTVPSGFEYKVVSFDGVEPDHGPVAGGTNISLSGVNLDIGLEQAVKIGRTSCRIQRVENKLLHCTTISVNYKPPQKMQVTLVIDGAEVPFKTVDNLRPTFTYMPNPVISNISPSNATFSENFTIVANGVFLDSAAAPKILVAVDSLNFEKRQTYVRDCQVLKGGHKMLCPGPSLLQFSVFSRAELRNQRFRVPAFISFHMDGLHLPPSNFGRPGYFSFYYLPTPQLDRYAELEATTGASISTERTVTAVFSGIKPCFGPAAGGTNITLFGTDLDFGTQRRVTIGGSVCTLYRMNSSFLECTTTTVTNMSLLGQVTQVVLTIDGTEVPFIQASMSSSFIYKPDPIIEDITPKRATFRQVGNYTIAVTGSHLDSVYRPVIVTQVTSQNLQQKEYIRKECHVTKGGFKMLCPGASLMDSSVMSSSDLKALNDSVQVLISFQMDGLRLPLAANGGNGYFTFTYQPEPQFKKFPEEGRIVESSELAVEIKGSHFEIFMDHEQVLIRVNGLDDACNVTNVSSHSITCKMKPGVLEEDSPGALEVVYDGRSYLVGSVKLMATEQPELDPSVIAGSAVAALVAVVLAGVVSFLCHRRRHRVKGTWETDCVVHLDKRHNKSDSSTDASNRYVREGNTDAQQVLMEAPIHMDEETIAMLTRENLLIHRELLQLGPVIGQGHFGCVYLGTMKLEGKGHVQHVAVKTLHNSSRGGEVDSMAFLEEALIMKDFHHVNVLPLIGLSIDKNDGLMVIIPYMKYGDLLSYIRDERNAPTVKQLITFGLHVAEGMRYLADIKFVHRDLAARNCMLSEDFIVRVADFGLSRDVYEKDYYSGDNKKTKLPVKWMAPESLEKGIYNHKTDVWSYGVLLWELITRGVTPYPEVDNWDIVDYLKQGRRMKQPTYCPDEMYAIMLRCWQDDPKKRPSFAKLVMEITNVLTSLGKKKRNRRLGLNVTYINCPRPDPTESAGPSVESHIF
ncbi:hypothetical protein HPB50_022348 [Hyalomma asiaticum]|uniref:Uncharacterized protein n=1 Tax=Hyalomma asiaticum TaxID=266040 RepID=A0ACB7S4V1_HYAAI|nr:hypothetical protein HPB50_022348 [Hyalomma asiaticum]